MAFSKVILNNETLMDVTSDTVEASNLLSGNTATAANGQKVTGTLTINDFVITLTQNQTSGNLEPDCTFSEALAAYNAGKNIAFVLSDGYTLCSGAYVPSQNFFSLEIASEFNDFVHDHHLEAAYYLWSATGIQKQEGTAYYDLYEGTATPAQVKSGEVFYNADGYQVGTAAARSSSDLTVSGATVTAPAGYYASAASKSVATATHANPTASINSSTGLVTASHTQTAGYVSAGTTTGTLQLTTQAAATITPSTASQTAVAAGLYTLGAVTVAPIPSAYIIPSGTLSITSNSTYDVTQYASVDVNCPTGRSDAEWILHSTGALADITGGSYSHIRSGAFFGTGIQTMDLPNATYIGEVAFAMCIKLSSVNIPLVRTIYSYAFSGCTSITDMQLESAVTIYSNAFQKCYALSNVSAPRLSSIYSSAFYLCTNLQTVYFPQLKIISHNAFESCTHLTSFDGPNVSNLASSAFQYCSALQYVSFPMITYLADCVFRACGLKQVYFPEVLSMDVSAFYSCASLSYVEMPKLVSVKGFMNLPMLESVSFAGATNLSNGAFSNCSRLTSVYLPNVTSVSAYAFYSCIALPLIKLPKLSSTNTSMFYGCTELSNAVFGELGYIGAGIFTSCVNLISLYLLKSTICSLYNTATFNSTPIYNYSTVAGRWGSIFVPASLYDTYRSATNWATFADRFVSLTDAEIEELLAE